MDRHQVANMWENILVIIILVLCLFFVGRRFIRNLRNAANKNTNFDCSGDCGSCSSGKKLKKNSERP